MNRNKFNARKCKANGMSFDSRAERDYALSVLEPAKQKGVIRDYFREISYDLLAYDPIRLCWKTCGKHKPDFTVHMHDGSIEVREVKGGRVTKTDAWSLRKRIFEINYPQIRYVVIEWPPRPQLKTWDKFREKWVPKVIDMDSV